MILIEAKSRKIIAIKIYTFTAENPTDDLWRMGTFEKDYKNAWYREKCSEKSNKYQKILERHKLQPLSGGSKVQLHDKNVWKEKWVLWKQISSQH